MKPEPAVPADQLILLRQQLILAQVRIMELEDTRDELTPKIAELEKLLASAQLLADRKTEETGQLEQVRTELQAQFEHLRHVQHVTNEALAASRAELDAAGSREKVLLSEIENLQILTRQLAESSRSELARIASLEGDLASIRAESAVRQERVTQLDAEQRAMKSSRSWRWTAWLRSLERTFAGKP